MCAAFRNLSMYVASRSLSHNVCVCVYSTCNLLRPCTVHYWPSRRSCSLHSSANIATCSGVYGSILAVFTLVRLHPFLHLMFSMGLCNRVLLLVVKRMSGLRGFITGFCLITPSCSAVYSFDNRYRFSFWTGGFSS